MTPPLTPNAIKAKPMNITHRTLLVGTILSASVVFSNAAVLYTNAGQLVNEASVTLPSMSVSRDASATGTLYFKYTVTNPISNSTNENYFAALQLYEGGTERLGVGNGWDPYAYSAYNTSSGNKDLNSANPEPGEVYQLVRNTDLTTIVLRVDFVSGGDDNISVWLNPNLSQTEASQSSSLKTTFTANATFNNILLREGGGGGGWSFSDIAIAENSSDTGFFAAVPETSTSLLGALGMIFLLKRRR